MMARMNKDPRNKDLPRFDIIDRKSAEFMRRLSGVERIRLACALGDGLRRMVRHHLETQHPDWSDEQIRQEMMRRAGYGPIRSSADGK
jgi:hypothetical protein